MPKGSQGQKRLGDVIGAVRILLTKVAKERAFPFDLTPNALTADTMRKSKREEDVHYAKDADGLFEDLGISHSR